MHTITDPTPKSFLIPFFPQDSPPCLLNSLLLLKVPPRVVSLAFLPTPVYSINTFNNLDEMVDYFKEKSSKGHRRNRKYK